MSARPQALSVTTRRSCDVCLSNESGTAEDSTRMTAQLLADAQRVLRSCASSTRGSTAQQAAQRSLAQQVAHRLLALKARRRCECCWLAERHCVCGALPALAPLRRVRRIFTVVPPHELGNPASSIKLLHAAYPRSTRWAVSVCQPQHCHWPQPPHPHNHTNSCPGPLTRAAPQPRPSHRTHTGCGAAGRGVGRPCRSDGHTHRAAEVYSAYGSQPCWPQLMVTAHSHSPCPQLS